jgi:hypothetical protein
MPLTRTNVGDLTTYGRSFERSLQATNKSPRTVETYLDALDQLCAFLETPGDADRGRGRDPRADQGVPRRSAR